MNDDLKQTLKRFLPASLVVATRPMRQYFNPQRRFDRRLGVDTCGAVQADELDFGQGLRRHASGYEPTAPAVFHRILRNVPVRPERCVFVDMGSGKGAVLLYALDYPFRRILGVELSPQLHAIAQRNLEHVQGRRSRPLVGAASGDGVVTGSDEVLQSGMRARSLCMSAADFIFPPEPTLVFLGNPFKGQLLDTVVGNLGRSLQQHPREVLVVYYHRLSRHGAWDGAVFLEVIRREADHTIYRSQA
jgi:hypothetical protein